MNQLCKVCGEPAAGFHFGAFTCEGCKSFFGRTYNNLHSISECKNNGECIINKKNRTACKACRLRKCLIVGMSKSGSRYGRRSNWFKIHCLLQEQQQAQQQQHHHSFGVAAATATATMEAAAAFQAAAAARLLRPSLMPPHSHTPSYLTQRYFGGGSESDSGASSSPEAVDAEEMHLLKMHHQRRMKKSPASDGECFDRRRFFSALANAPPPSPASLPAAMMPNSGTTCGGAGGGGGGGGGSTAVVPRWLTPTVRPQDFGIFRDLWLRDGDHHRAHHAAQAPDQSEPIDLSIRNSGTTPSSPNSCSTLNTNNNNNNNETLSDTEDLCIDVGVEEQTKPTVPLDLTLDSRAAKC